MKKPLLLSLFILIYLLPVNAQNIVSTEIENKNVVLEEYTGIKCGYCPEGHAIAQAIKDDHPEDVVLINIHQGSFAVPEGEQPDFRTPWGEALAEQYGISSYPTGTINRHLFNGGNGVLDRSAWAGAANQILAQESYLNVACEATVIAATRQLMVLVEVYYTGDSPVSSNFLNVALLQNNVIGYQTGDDNYHHMHMLRHFLTGQWGIEITETTEGSLFSTTLYYDVPEDYREIPVILENLEIAAFVSENQQEIISGTMAEINFIEPVSLDAGIVEAKVPQTSCGEIFEADIKIKNYGTDEITSLDFEYSVNTSELQNYSWTGNLSSLETVEFTLPAFDINAEQYNLFNINMLTANSEEDEFPQNNIARKYFEKTAYFPQNCRLLILTDENPEEITWEIKNSTGDIIAEGGPYNTTSIFIEPFTWPENDCYKFIIYDAGGDGMTSGFYKIVNSSNQAIWEGSRDFEYSTSAEFAYDELMNEEQISIRDKTKVYPNPATNQITIESSEIKKIQILNMSGQVIFESSKVDDKTSIDISKYSKGIYVVKMDAENETLYEKIVVE